MDISSMVGAMTPMRKMILAGVGILTLGGVAGYAVGNVAGRTDSENGRGVMLRDGSGRGDGVGNRWSDDGRGQNGVSNGVMQNQNRGQRGGMQQNGTQTQGQGQGTGMMNGQGGRAFGRNECVADECLAVDGLEYPAGALTDAAKSAIFSAIDDEYKAHATYEAVIAKFGSVRPFSMIIRSEEQHISSLKALLDKYGVAIPSDSWTGKVTAPDSITAACQTGVDAEIANAALYREKLLPAVTEYSDITSVFTNLMNASQEKHLPAFDRCN